MRSLICSRSISSHAFCICSQSSSSDVATLEKAATFVFKRYHLFSMGFRSGEEGDGQEFRFPFQLSSFAMAERCEGAPSSNTRMFSKLEDLSDLRIPPSPPKTPLITISVYLGLLRDSALVLTPFLTVDGARGRSKIGIFGKLIAPQTIRLCQPEWKVGRTCCGAYASPTRWVILGHIIPSPSSNAHSSVKTTSRQSPFTLFLAHSFLLAMVLGER